MDGIMTKRMVCAAGKVQVKTIQYAIKKLTEDGKSAEEKDLSETIIYRPDN